jgi:hypothetical protein
MERIGGEQDFAEETFGHAELGDKRRTKRLVDAAAAIASRPDASIPVACEENGARLEGFYKLVRNDAVEPEAIRQSVFDATSSMAGKSAGDLLLVQDTTSISPVHGLRETLRSKHGSPSGYEVHSGLVVDASNGVPLGVLQQLIWSRSSQSEAQSTMKVESDKWRTLDEATHALDIAQKRLIRVCDRESDIYSYLLFLQEHSHRFVLRGVHNRRLTKKQGSDEASQLWDAATAASIVGEREIQIEQRGGQAKGLEQSARAARPRRTITTTLRATSVSVREPDGNGSIDVNLVYVSSEEDNLNWLLLTQESISTLEDIQRVVSHYEHRWLIERFHKCWKTGCKIESRRMGSEDSFLRMMAITMPVALRLLRLQVIAHLPTQSHRPATEVLSETEVKILWNRIEKTPLPNTSPSCLWAIRAIAKLVGWTDSKRTGRVGVETLWKGHAKLQLLMEGWVMAQACNK